MAWESQEAQAPDERPCTSGTWFWSSTVYSWGHYTVPWQIRFVGLSPQPTVQVLSCLLHTRLLSWKTSHTHVGTMYVWYTNAMRTASHLSASSWVLLALVWVSLGILNSDDMKPPNIMHFCGDLWGSKISSCRPRIVVARHCDACRFRAERRSIARRVIKKSIREMHIVASRGLASWIGVSFATVALV